LSSFVCHVCMYVKSSNAGIENWKWAMAQIPKESTLIMKWNQFSRNQNKIVTKDEIGSDAD